MKNGARIWMMAALAAGLLAACTGGEKGKQAGAEASPPPSAGTGQATGSEPARPAPAVTLVEAARRQGVNKCLPRIEQLVKGLAEGSTYRAYATAHDDKPDERLYALVLSRLNPQNTHQLVSATVVPDKNCSATYDISTVWGLPCEQVAQQVFGSLKPAGTLAGNVRVLQGSELQQVYLLPASGGCLTLRKETLY